MKKILLIIIAAVCLTACQQKSKKTSGDLDKDIKEMAGRNPGINAGSGSFDIDAIEGWTKTDTTISGVRAVFLKAPIEGSSDIFMENINVVTEQAKDYSLDKYFDANVTMIKNQMPGFVKINSGNVTVNGLEGSYIAYSHEYFNTPTDVESYFFVKNDIGYVITCSAQKGRLAKWKPSFEKMVNTFTIN